MVKTSIRFFENVPVRSVWKEEGSRWLRVVDVLDALSLGVTPRK